MIDKILHLHGWTVESELVSVVGEAPAPVLVPASATVPASEVVSPLSPLLPLPEVSVFPLVWGSWPDEPVSTGVVELSAPTVAFPPPMVTLPTVELSVVFPAPTVELSVVFPAPTVELSVELLPVELVALDGAEVLAPLACPLQILQEFSRMIPPNLKLIHSAIDSIW